MNIGLLFKILGVIASIALGIGAPFVYKKVAKKELRQDNVLEELAEEIIKESTGIDIDFTPESPEKYNNDSTPIGAMRG